MSCGLSMLEVCGWNIAYQRILRQEMAKKDLPINLWDIECHREIANGICRPIDARGDRDKHIKTRSAVPLHKSSAVLRELSAMASKDEQKQEKKETIYSELDQRAIDALQSFHSISKSSSNAKHSHKQQKAISALESRSVQRTHPYMNSKRSSPHVTLEKQSVGGSFHASRTCTHDLTIHEKISGNDHFEKSFSTPGELYMQAAHTSSGKTPSMIGDQMSVFAIRNLARVCMKETLAQELPSNILPTEGLLPLEKTKKLKSKASKTDNFRKLILPQLDSGTGSLSARDLALQRLIGDALATHGICVIDGLLGNEEAMKMKKEVLTLHSRCEVVKGGLIGSGKKESDTRGDLITWVEGTEPSCPLIRRLCQKMDSIVSLGMGVAPAYKICGGTKVMVARYPGGGTKYKLHVDNANKDGRCLTCLYYLNEDWNTETMGGTLRIHAQTSGKTANIAPTLDRLAVFYSDGRNPHEVLPCNANRYAITLWYFDLNERTNALKRMDSAAASSSTSTGQK